MKIVLEEDQIKEEAPERIIPFRELSFKQKLEHIWEYYKWKIIIPIISVACCISIGFTLYQNFKDSAMYAVFMNTLLNETTGDELMDDFISYADIDMKGKKATLDSTLYIKHGSSDVNSVSSSQKILAMFTSIEMDIIICEEDNLKFYAAQDAFTELSEVLPKEFLDSHSDLLISAKDKSGQDKVLGISLKDAPKLKEYGAYTASQEPILTIPVTHMEDENIYSFVKFLLGE